MRRWSGWCGSTQRELRPEIFARVTATAVFDKLSYDTQCRIAGAMVEKEIAAKAALGFALSADPNVADVVIKRGYDDRESRPADAGCDGTPRPECPDGGSVQRGQGCRPPLRASP